MAVFDGTFTTRIGGCPAGSPLLPYLVKRFPYLDAAAWSERLKQGALTLDGVSAQADSPVRPGQTLSYRFSGFEEPDLPQDARVLARSHGLALLHKPAGLPLHKTGKIVFQTLARWAETHLGVGYAPLHRLDRETSGLVAFAEGAETFRRFAPEGRSLWTKLYLAIARGHLPARGGHLDVALGPQPGDAIRSRMQAVAGGKPALTLWWLLKTVGECSVVVAAPITGRKHQIRAHLAHAGHALVGDKMYSLDGAAYLKRLENDLTAEDYRALGAEHHLLHAFYLRIEDGETGIEGFDFELPSDFATYITSEELKAWAGSPGFAEACAEARARRLGLRPQ